MRRLSFTVGILSCALFTGVNPAHAQSDQFFAPGTAIFGGTQQTSSGTKSCYVALESLKVVGSSTSVDSISVDGSLRAMGFRTVTEDQIGYLALHTGKHWAIPEPKGGFQNYNNNPFYLVPRFDADQGGNVFQTEWIMKEGVGGGPTKCSSGLLGWSGGVTCSQSNPIALSEVSYIVDFEPSAVAMNEITITERISDAYLPSYANRTFKCENLHKLTVEEATAYLKAKVPANNPEAADSVNQFLEYNLYKGDGN